MSTLENGDVINHRPNKRRRVAVEERKRVAKACPSCRRLKEKCDGASPCSRCIRYGRPCEDVATSTSADSDVEARIGRLEAIAKYFLGDVALDFDSLEGIINDLRFRQGDGLGPSGIEEPQMMEGDRLSMVRGRISYLGFTKQLHEAVRDRLQAAGIPMPDTPPCNGTQDDHILYNIAFSRSQIPPKDVAIFLSGAYFEFAQINDIWIERTSFDATLEQLYDFDRILTAKDGPWICSVLLVFSIGVQVAYLASRTQDDAGNTSTDQIDASFDNETSIKFYRMATSMLPDVFLLPSVNSAQALMMFAHFALSWSMCGPALEFLETAKAMTAITSGELASHCDHSPADVSLSMDRIRQVASLWSERLRILNGYSLSSKPSIQSAYLSPLSFVSGTKLDPKTTDTEIKLTIDLTNWLSVFDQCLKRLGLSKQACTSSGIQHIMGVRQRYKDWWSSLLVSRSPVLQLNRDTAYPHLLHHMNLIFLGRSFAFMANANNVESDPPTDMMNDVAELVDDAEYSAYEIIDICSTLDKAGGLTASNYLEFSTCKAAVFVMLAQSLAGRCLLFRDKLQQGVDTIRRMTDNASISKLSITAIYESISRLEPHKRHQKYGPKQRSCINPKHGFESFMNWKGWANIPVDTDVLTTYDLAFGGILNEDVFDIGTIDFADISRISGVY